MSARPTPTTPPDLTSTSRLRAKKYAAAHAVYVTKKHACKLVVVRDPAWAALRSKGPLITLDAPVARPGESRRASRAVAVTRDAKKQEEDWLIAQLVERVNVSDVIHEEEEEAGHVEGTKGSESPNRHAKLPPIPPTDSPQQPDSTFLTSTSLINAPSPPTPIPPPSLTLDDIDLERYFAEFRMPAIPAWDAPLPTDIAKTTRLLRLALLHPTHYWKVTAPRFAKPTRAVQAKTRKNWKRVYLDDMYKMEAAAVEAAQRDRAKDRLADVFDSQTSVGSASRHQGQVAGDGSGVTDADIDLEAALKDDPGLRSPVHSEWSDASLADLPSARALGSVKSGGAKKQSKEIRSFVGASPTKAVGKRGGKAGGRDKTGLLKLSNAANSLLATKVREPKDGMDEVRVLMKKVHYKLQLLESELARINTEESRKRRERALLRAGGSRMLFAPGGMGVELGGSRLSFLGGSKMSFQSKLSLNAGGGGLDLSGWSGGGGGGGGGGLGTGMAGLGGGGGLLGIPVKGRGGGGGGSMTGLGVPHGNEGGMGRSVGSLAVGSGDGEGGKRKAKGAGGLEVNMLGMS